MNDDPVEAARRSLDPERRLPGENLDSTDPQMLPTGSGSTES